MNKIKLVGYSIILFGLLACEDKIDLDLESGRSQLTVDAFLTNDSSIQTIRLTKSGDYFLNAPTSFENNAQVEVVGPNGLTYNFTSDGKGNFEYDPNTAGAIDSIGFTYQLNLIYEGNTYISFSTLNPVPSIDSMTVSFEEEELGEEEGYYTQFFARDIPGRTDFYWAKPFRNGEAVFKDDPSFLILFVDAAFGSEGADGLPFILPIRAAITDEEEPFLLGEVSSVELYSLNEEVYEFLEQVTIQASNGGLFSTPIANVRSNVLDAAGNQQEEVLGVFSLSALSKAEIIITP